MRAGPSKQAHGPRRKALRTQPLATTDGKRVKKKKKRKKCSCYRTGGNAAGRDARGWRQAQAPTGQADKPVQGTG